MLTKPLDTAGTCIVLEEKEEGDHEGGATAAGESGAQDSNPTTTHRKHVRARLKTDPPFARRRPPISDPPRHPLCYEMAPQLNGIIPKLQHSRTGV